MKHSRIQSLCQYYFSTANSINMVSTELECTLLIYTQVILSTFKSQTHNTLTEKLSVPTEQEDGWALLDSSVPGSSLR